MAASNFPNGFSQGVTIRGVPILNTHSGKVYWVDSNGSYNDNYAGTFDKPFSSIENAFNHGALTAGDIIMAKAGHVETVTAAGALGMDVAGVAVVFLGEGASRAYITFTTAVGADMDIDAASITLVRPKFVAGIDSLTGPIDVNAADFTIIDGEWHDATDIETTDCIVATAGATRLTIDGWKFFCGTETGDQKQSHIQLNGCDDIVLQNIDIRGNFFVGCIENVTDEVLNARFKDIYLENLNATPKPAMFIDADATGSCQNVKCKIASGSTYVSNVGKLSWDGDCEGFMGDGYSGDPLGTTLATGIEGKIDIIDAHYDALPKCVAKTDGAVLTGADNLFTITGGPVRCKIVGLVTTIVGGASNGKLTFTSTTPAATVDLSAAAVAIDNDAAGTIYTSQGATAVFTPSAGLGYDKIDPVLVEETEFILAPGTVKFDSSAARTGVIAWYMTFTPLSPLSVVAAAA
jgi:hypothetical protein